MATKKYGLGGFIKKYSPLGMNPANVLSKRPLTFKTLLDPAGLFTDDNYSKDYKKKKREAEMAETSETTPTMRKGGNVKKAKMEMKHAKFMKKKGAPKKMVKEEMSEAKGYAKGGSIDGCAVRGKTKGKMR